MISDDLEGSEWTRGWERALKCHLMSHLCWNHQKRSARKQVIETAIVAEKLGRGQEWPGGIEGNIAGTLGWAELDHDGAGPAKL